MATSPTPNCSTGSWSQKLSCGWHEPTTGAAHAGTATGHTGAPILIGIVIVALILLAISKAGKSRSAAPQRS